MTALSSAALLPLFPACIPDGCDERVVTAPPMAGAHTFGSRVTEPSACLSRSTAVPTPRSDPGMATCRPLFALLKLNLLEIGVEFDGPSSP